MFAAPTLPLPDGTRRARGVRDVWWCGRVAWRAERGHPDGVNPGRGLARAALAWCAAATAVPTGAVLRSNARPACMAVDCWRLRHGHRHVLSLVRLSVPVLVVLVLVATLIAEAVGPAVAGLVAAGPLFGAALALLPVALRQAPDRRAVRAWAEQHAERWTIMSGFSSARSGAGGDLALAVFAVLDDVGVDVLALTAPTAGRLLAHYLRLGLHPVPDWATRSRRVLLHRPAQRTSDRVHGPHDDRGGGTAQPPA